MVDLSVSVYLCLCDVCRVVREYCLIEDNGLEEHIAQVQYNNSECTPRAHRHHV